MHNGNENISRNGKLSIWSRHHKHPKFHSSMNIQSHRRVQWLDGPECSLGPLRNYLKRSGHKNPSSYRVRSQLRSLASHQGLVHSLTWAGWCLNHLHVSPSPSPSSSLFFLKASDLQMLLQYLSQCNSPAESQKGVNAVQRCSVEIQKEAIAILICTVIAPFWNSTEHL